MAHRIELLFWLIVASAAAVQAAEQNGIEALLNLEIVVSFLPLT